MNTAATSIHLYTSVSKDIKNTTSLGIFRTESLVNEYRNRKLSKKQGVCFYIFLASVLDFSAMLQNVVH
jgi:hypothetical protein